MQVQACEVIIVGCGPTGVVLANLLGASGVSTLVLERDAELFPLCRATHMDEETLRNLQATGLLPSLEPHTAPFGVVEVADEHGAVLFAEQIRERDNAHGREGSRFFDQPALERVLRGGLARYPSVTLRTGAEVIAIDADDGGAELRTREPEGERCYRGSWVVACDGGRSVVRAALGIAMRSLAPRRQWLIVDATLNDPSDAARLPGCFRYVLAPERLTLYAHGIGLNRRWEFQLDEGEAPPDAATLRRWLQPFIDPDRLTLLRVAPYAHSALIAERWREGRVLLAGDAAHMMPPSAGQGLCSGVRDALNLAWKLARVVRGHSPPSLLDSYEHERSWHVGEILAGTLFIGSRLEANGPVQRWRRHTEMRLLSQLPTGLRALLRQHALRHPVITRGCLDESAPLRGSHVPRAVLRGGEDLDDRVGYRFSLILRDGLSPGGALPPGVLPLRLHAELDGCLRAWMDEHAIDYVLVRPDRLVFSAGRASTLPDAIATLRRALSCPDDAQASAAVAQPFTAS